MIMGFDGLASLKAARDGIAPMPDGVGARLRHIYQVAYRVPPTNATATAQMALRRSKLEPNVVRRAQRDDRTLISMGHGNLRDRLHQTFFPSPYDGQIHDWGRDPASDFLEPLSTGSIAGESYTGGGLLSLGNYSIAEINGLAGRGDWWDDPWADSESETGSERGFKWDAPHAVDQAAGTFVIKNPNGDTWQAYRASLTPHHTEKIGDATYLVADHTSGKRVYIPVSMAADGGLSLAATPPLKKKVMDRGPMEMPDQPGTPEMPFGERASLWLRDNATLVGVTAAAGVLVLWLASRRRAVA